VGVLLFVPTTICEYLCVLVSPCGGLFLGLCRGVSRRCFVPSEALPLFQISLFLLGVRYFRESPSQVFLFQTVTGPLDGQWPQSHRQTFLSFHFIHCVKVPKKSPSPVPGKTKARVDRFLLRRMWHFFPSLFNRAWGVGGPEGHKFGGMSTLGAAFFRVG